MKIKAWFFKLVAGMGIGTGAAIPGVSGAAIAVILKVYEEIIWAVNNFRKHFKRALTILIPILLGIIIAVIPCIIVFNRALEQFVFITMCVFAGFLIGSFPGVKKEVEGVKPTKRLMTYAIIGFIFVIILGVASVFLGRAIDIDAEFAKMDPWMYFVLIPVGAIAAVALTVPGLSGSLILLIVGFYKPLLKYTTEWAKDFLGVDGHPQTWDTFGKWIGMLGCFAIGVLIGVVLVSKIMSKLLEKHRNETYYSILGFIIGSIFVLFFNYNIFEYYLVWGGESSTVVDPYLKQYIEIIIGIVCLLLAATLSYLLVWYANKAKAKQIKTNE